MVVSESNADVGKAAAFLATAATPKNNPKETPGGDSPCGRCCANLAALLSPRATAYANGLCVVSALPGAARSDSEVSMMALGCGGVAKALGNQPTCQ